MANWKNLRDNPPDKDCNICVKVGDNYETFKFRVHTEYCWSLHKYLQDVTMDKMPEEALYINLDEIK